MASISGYAARQRIVSICGIAARQRVDRKRVDVRNVFESGYSVCVRAGIMGRIERRQFDCDSNAADGGLVVTKLEIMSAGASVPAKFREP